MGSLLGLGRFLLTTATGRALLIVAALGLCAWRLDAWAYGRGYAARQAEDTVATAALQRRLIVAADQTAATADRLATAQINVAALQSEFDNATVRDPAALRCSPDAGELQQLRGLWTRQRAALAAQPGR